MRAGKEIANKKVSATPTECSEERDADRADRCRFGDRCEVVTSDLPPDHRIVVEDAGGAERDREAWRVGVLAVVVRHVLSPTWRHEQIAMD